MKLVYNLDFKIKTSLSFITDQQILELQDVFLTNGLHSITVMNIKEGRSLVYMFMEALRCFNTVGCITKSIVPLKGNIFNIDKHLQAFGPLDLETAPDFTPFCGEYFDFDCIWIECFQENDWLLIQKRIQECGIEKRIPIIRLQILEKN